jgi:hypothetical protein
VCTGRQVRVDRTRHSRFHATTSARSGDRIASTPQIMFGGRPIC